MTLPDLHDAMEPTWPPAATQHLGPWLLRQGDGGGKRVSAASALAGVTSGDLAMAEAAMRAMGQEPLFVIRPADVALDAMLAAQGYRVVDPVMIYAAACAPLAVLHLPDLAAIAHWPPLEIARSLWAEGGIGPERVAVMERVALAKTVFLGRAADRSAGVGFVAAAGKVAFVHALEVRPALRRLGTGRHILIAAARWAMAQGAGQLALAVTVANGPARHLYATLGMVVEGQYHYRQE